MAPTRHVGASKMEKILRHAWCKMFWNCFRFLSYNRSTRTLIAATRARLAWASQGNLPFFARRPVVEARTTNCKWALMEFKERSKCDVRMVLPIGYTRGFFLLLFGPCLSICMYAINLAVNINSIKHTCMIMRRLGVFFRCKGVYFKIETFDYIYQYNR